MNDTARTLILMVVITLVLMLVFRNLSTPMVSNIPYSTFISEVKNGNIKSVTIEGSLLKGTRSDNTRFSTYSPETGNEALIEIGRAHV